MVSYFDSYYRTERIVKKASEIAAANRERINNYGSAPDDSPGITMSNRIAKQYKEAIISRTFSKGKVTEKVTSTPITSQLMVKLNKRGDTETLKDITTSVKTIQKKFGLPQTGTMNGTVAKQLSNLGKSTSNKGTYKAEQEKLKALATNFHNASDPISKISSFIAFGIQDWKLKSEVFNNAVTNHMISQGIDPQLAQWGGVLTTGELSGAALGQAINGIKAARGLATGAQFSNELVLADGLGSGSGSNSIKNLYNSIKDSPKYPQRFKPVQNGLTKVNIKNVDVLDELKKIETSQWKKVYKDGFDAAGNKISIHYFESSSGKVFDVKVKLGWSNN